MMADLTNKKIDFLSNERHINILRSILDEIDFVASYGAHRSTTYLAVSVIEGLFRELIPLRRIQPKDGVWPKDKAGKYCPLDDLDLFHMEKILNDNEALPQHFKDRYDLLREFRNYIHTAVELRKPAPITQSIGQLALACLNALIELYSAMRFVAGQQWELIHGIAQVPDNAVIHMPQNPGDDTSLIISKFDAKDISQVIFQIVTPPDAIFNFVYNYRSLNDFMAARIEGRVNQKGEGYDNGQLVCKVWRAWTIANRYAVEPNPQKQQHTVHVTFEPPGNLSMVVDGTQLVLKDGGNWNFDPQGKIGFMTEHGMVSVIDLKVKPAQISSH